MWLLILPFATSAILTGFVIRYQHLHNHITGDHDFDSPQKFHNAITPRIGGIAILMGFAIATLYQWIIHPNIGTLLVLVLIASLPVFIAGIAEDITKRVSVKMRFFAGFITGILFLWLFDITTMRFGFGALDVWLNYPWFVVLFLAFGVTGLSNAYNIIDGFNGLSSMVSMITLVGIGYMGIQMNDPLVAFLSFTMTSAILGFFIWNYPRGLIFLGDGGAYLIGFWVASMTLLITSRHPEISPWFAIIINAYPILETLFTIYRRKFRQDKSPDRPDGIHFHSLIYRRILNKKCFHSELDWFNANSKTSPYLWVLSILAVFPAILFWDSTPILLTFLAIFTIIYVWLYKKIVNFKTPNWMYP